MCKMNQLGFPREQSPFPFSTPTRDFKPQRQAYGLHSEEGSRAQRGAAAPPHHTLGHLSFHFPSHQVDLATYLCLCCPLCQEHQGLPEFLTPSSDIISCWVCLDLPG